MNKLSWTLFLQVLGATVVFQFVANFLLFGLKVGVLVWFSDYYALLLEVVIFSIWFFWPVLFFALYRSPYPEHRWRVWGAWMALSVAEFAYGAGPLYFLVANYFYAMVWLGTPVIALIGALLGNWLFKRRYDVAPLSR